MLEQFLAQQFQLVHTGVAGDMAAADHIQSLLDFGDITAAHQAADELQVAAPGFTLALQAVCQGNGILQLFIQGNLGQFSRLQVDQLFSEILQSLRLTFHLALAGAFVFPLVVGDSIKLILHSDSIFSSHT